MFTSMSLSGIISRNAAVLVCLPRAFARLAEDPFFHFSRILSPGDIEIIHNPTVLHARGNIKNGEVIYSTLAAAIFAGCLL